MKYTVEISNNADYLIQVEADNESDAYYKADEALHRALDSINELSGIEVTYDETSWSKVHNENDAF